MKLDDSIRKQLPGETDTWLDRLSGEVGKEFEEAYQDYVKTLPPPDMDDDEEFARWMKLLEVVRYQRIKGVVAGLLERFTIDEINEKTLADLPQYRW